jgi:hypothetical protein
MSRIHGKVRCTRIGNYNGTTNAAVAVLLRTSTGGDAACTDVNMEFEVYNTNIPFVGWLNSGTLDDTRINLKFQAFDCAVDAQYITQHLMNFETVGGRAGRAKNVTIDLELNRCTWNELLRTVVGNSASDVIVRGRTDKGDFLMKDAALQMPNSRNARMRHAQRHVFKRSCAQGEVIAPLNPDVSWYFFVFPVDGVEQGAFYEGYYEPTTKTVTHLRNVAGQNNTGWTAAFNVANTTPFPNGALEVKAGPTFSNSAVIESILIAYSVEDASSVQHS